MEGSPAIEYFEADVRFYPCGQTAGVLWRAAGSRAAVEAFRRRADGTWSVIRSLTSLRCDRCAGPLFAEEIRERYRYRPEPDRNRPRRERPRKYPVSRSEAQRPGA